MGNGGATIKRFLSNKNTVTFFCVILGVIVLFAGYNWRVNQATNPVKIPYAKVKIDAKTEIKAEMIGYTDVPSSLVSTAKTLVTNGNDVIGKYSSYTTSIPKNSYFYSDILMEEEQMPDYAFMNMADGYTVYSLKVSMDTTYANKIFPNTYIDLYAKATDDSGKIMFARLIQSIKVKAVKDERGNALLENGINNGSPSAMLFEVPDELFDLLKKAEYVDGVEIVPVPRNANYTAAQGETEIDNDTIKEYVYSKCIKID